MDIIAIQASIGNSRKLHTTSGFGTRLTLDAFVSQIYLPHARMRKRSWEVDERIARRHLSPVFGSRRICEITTLEVERCLDNLRESGLAPATCNRILAALKSICALAEVFGHIPFGLSPCRQVRPLKVASRRDRFLSLEEGKKLMAYLRANDRKESKALQLLLLTGARKSEILRAKWENLDLDNRMLTVPLSKSGKPRYIYLSEEAVKIFRSIQHEQGSGWIFPGRKPEKPISDIYQFWNKTRCQLGLKDVRVHDLRHTFASYLVSNGHTLYEAQQLLGHSDPRTTMRYAHFVQRALVEATGSVSRLLTLSDQGKEKWKRRKSWRKFALAKTSMAKGKNLWTNCRKKLLT